ncbi:protein kinase domain-containing protein [Nocardia sp. alder85J]|uniref:protein kinase domain-containing protein n=1 Tax=Nocardia sp. alder85J TaxID=2862949 RepID=UPI002104E63E|nr:protein kinase [Nocardia sp. alder85J]MCX4095298.1 protein kinase [Nocardia sp. alder85J]
MREYVNPQSPLSIAWVVAVAAQIATALSYAHAVPVVHRDLKPDNILVTPDGTVKIIDFGIAALLTPGTSRLTKAGVWLGTCRYMAPEQGAGAQPTPRADLYALGCVVYEMLCGQPVFDGVDTKVLYDHAFTVPTPPREIRAEVPDELDQLVRELLAEDPEQRPADAATVYERLFPLLPSPGAPMPPSGGYLMRAVLTDVRAVHSDGSPLTLEIRLLSPGRRTEQHAPVRRRAFAGRRSRQLCGREAIAIIMSISAEYCDASHNILAYSCQGSDSLARLSGTRRRTFMQGAQVIRPQPRRRTRVDVGPLVEFAEFVTRRRHMLGLTQLDLADLAEVSVSTVRNVEAGRASPTLEVTLRVLDALGSTLVAMSQAAAELLPNDAADLGAKRSAGG